MSGMNIQPFIFDTEINYVLINIVVGKKRSIPRSVMMKQLKMVRQESQLCKVLEALDIPCDIMPAYVNAFDDGSAVQVSHSEVKGEEAAECVDADTTYEARTLATKEMDDRMKALGDIIRHPFD